MTLETQYKNYKITNPDTYLTFEQWKEMLGKKLERGLSDLVKSLNEEKKVICPSCGEKENFHFNYDYYKTNMPIEDVLCNECGHFFEIN